MRIHFFAAPFCCFHLVQGSRFKDLVAASPPFLEDGISYRSLPRWERLSDGDSSDTGETYFQHTGEPTPSRYARQPLPEEGARMWGVLSVSIPPSFGRRCPQGGGWRRRAE